jgi:hypothetical protein
LPIFNAALGEPAGETFANLLKQIQTLTYSQRKEQLMTMKKEALSVPQYSLPLFISHTAELALCPIEFQRLALRTRHHLDLMNHEILKSSKWFEMTFQALTQENRAKVSQNLDSSYDALKTQAEHIVSTIAELVGEYHATQCRVFFRRW